MADYVQGANIQGLKEVQANLANLGSKIQARVLRAALQAGADVLGHAVQEATPIKTGLLRSSVGTVVSISDREQGGVGVVGFGKQGFVARMVEFGHAQAGATGTRVGEESYRDKRGKLRKRNLYASKVKGNPFIRRAFEASKEQAAGAFAETFKSGFEGLK